MKSQDRLILTIVPVLVLVAAFWFLVLSPKRDEASQLGEQVTELETEVQAAEQAAEMAERSQSMFPDLYDAVVQLGKAVPEDDDTAALFTQITGLANKSGVAFRSIELDGAAAGAQTPPPPPPPPSEEGGEGEEGAEEGVEEGEEGAEEGAASPDAAPAVATEATAATLPIGASVGPAGFPVMRYKLEVAGGFFELSDFVRRVDRLVRVSENGEIGVRGRLMTIDGFTLAPNAQRGFPTLTGFLTMTTYVMNPAEGLTGGATPDGPGEATQPVADGPPSAASPPPEPAGGTP